MPSLMAESANAHTNAGWLRGAWINALPPLLPTMVGAFLWALAMFASAATVLVWDNWQMPDRIRTIAGFFAMGGFVAFPIGMILARFLSYRRAGETAFAAAFVSLAAASFVAIGGLFALEYRSYYAEWHADTFTRIWFFQFVFTIAAALYQFAVLGLRLFFPVGFIALIAASVWFARQAR